MTITLKSLKTIWINIFYHQCHCNGKSLFVDFETQSAMFLLSHLSITCLLLYFLYLANTGRDIGAIFSASTITIYSMSGSSHRQTVNQTYPNHFLLTFMGDGKSPKSTCHVLYRGLVFKAKQLTLGLSYFCLLSQLLI